MKKSTATLFDRAKPDPDKDIYLNDSERHGLCMRIKPSGLKTWVIGYQHQGKRVRVTIGEYDARGAIGNDPGDWLKSGRLSLAQARHIAHEWKRQRRAGRDPREEWQATLQAEREQDQAERDRLAAIAEAEAIERAKPTLGAIAADFIKTHVTGKKSAPAIEYRLRRLTDLLGDHQIHKITREQLLEALDSVAIGQKGKPAKQLAGEVLQVTKRLFRFAVSRGAVSASPLADLDRTHIDARPRKRSNHLQFDELARLWNALCDPDRCKADPVTIAALKLIILTGQRENEVCGMTWQEVDLEGRCWRLPATRTKTDKTHIVHLSRQALAVIDSMKPLNGRRLHVFASPRKAGQPIYGRSTWTALNTLLSSGRLEGVPTCSVHDLRRTMASLMPDLGIEPFIAERILNHVMTGVLAHYNHAQYLEQRQRALDAWGDRIEQLATGGNITQFRRVQSTNRA